MARGREHTAGRPEEQPKRSRAAIPQRRWKTYGFDAANAPFPQPDPASPSETFSYCPNPPNGTVSFSNPP